MPLVTCPDCRAQLSDASPSCPHCGRPNAGASAAPHAHAPPKRSGMSAGVIVAIVLGVVFGGTILLGIAAAIIIPKLASAGEEPVAVETPVVPVEASAAPETYASEEGHFGIRVDPDRWVAISARELNEEAEFGFQHVDGDAYALVISEKVGMPLSTLREVVVENLRSASSELRIVEEETRTVNGREILRLVVDASVDGIPIRYHGHYYSGDEGTLQVMTWTSQNLYGEYREDLTALLDGLEIYDRTAAAPVAVPAG